MIKQATKKKVVNLNKLTTGCSLCLNEAKKIERKIANREPSEIKIKEIKRITESLFSDD
tara:strand:+ start:175 stop:351 length:177 start_codon:yes stop_codon:yes gene_type:complete